MTLTSTPGECVREMDRIPDGAASVSLDAVDHTPVIGTWWNTNLSTWGIARAELTERDGRLRMRVWTADPAGDGHDWGEAVVERVYTDGPFSNRVTGYIATFDLGHARTQVQANMNHGLTVFAAFTTFTDGSGRLSYLSREFFHRRGDERGVDR